jgi:hypothetical protein
MQMKATRIAITAGILLGIGANAFAQHGHGGGGSGMGNSGMGHSSLSGASTHGNSGGSAQTTKGSGGKSISDHLSSQSKLSSKLQSLLPAGTDLKTASSGFKNLGQFVAAVHVSNNLGIPFDQLKAKMTGDHAESLGKAVHELKPDANAKSETKKANKQADADITESES